MGVRIISAVGLRDAHLAALADWDIAFEDPAASSVDGGDVEGLLVSSHFGVDAAMLATFPQLRAISTVSVGYDHIDVAAAAARSIAVTTTPVLSDAVADLTLALITMTLRRLGEAVADLSRGTWSNGLLGSDLRDKTLLLVGFGRIAREVAARAVAHKMRVVYFDVRADVAPMSGVPRVATLLDGLANADVVSLHVDLNPTTRHLIDEAALAGMKQTAILVNTSRGGVVDQAALTRALASGVIAGAGLDVLESEPPEPTDPLLAMPNVVVFPHIGSATTETRRAMLDCAVANLAACLRGEPCENVLKLPLLD